MTKPRAQVAPAQPAGATPEPPRQTAETAAEAGVPVVGEGQEPPQPPTKPETGEQLTQPAGDAGKPETGEQHDEPTDEESEARSWNKEGFAEFLREHFSNEEFAELWAMVQAEAQQRGIAAEPAAAPAPATEAPAEADPHAAVRAAMAAEGISTAYVLPNGSWRFSEAFALKAVDGNADLLTIIEA